MRTHTCTPFGRTPAVGLRHLRDKIRERSALNCPKSQLPPGILDYVSGLFLPFFLNFTFESMKQIACEQRLGLKFR